MSLAHIPVINATAEETIHQHESFNTDNYTLDLNISLKFVFIQSNTCKLQ